MVDDAIRAKIQRQPVTSWGLTLQHADADGCFINEPANPLAAVAYTWPKMQALTTSSGLGLIRPLLPGFWSGALPEADCGQDTTILGPGLTPNDLDAPWTVR
jgi:hypothetical protein